VAGTVPTGITDVSTEGTKVATPVVGFTSVKVPPAFGWSALPTTMMPFGVLATALTGTPGNLIAVPCFSVVSLNGMATLSPKEVIRPVPNESKTVIADPPGRFAVTPVRG